MDFKTYLTESAGVFSEEVKFSAGGMSQWKKEVKHIDAIDITDDGDLTLVYMSGKHLATYDNKKNVLMTDHIVFFGKYK